jgi:hypothetical protein
MPSDNMIRYPVDLYPDTDASLQQLLTSQNIKRSRFLRECVNYVLGSDTIKQTVITQSRQKSYVKVKR